jgi:hypothetical protein
VVGVLVFGRGSFQDGDAAPSGCATVVQELQRGKMQQQR